MDLPKTREPEKWNKDFSLSKKDFMNDKIGNTEINDLLKERGIESEYYFKDGYRINKKTGEKQNMFPN